jgi:hypothetical protein
MIDFIVGAVGGAIFGFVLATIIILGKYDN